MDKYERIIEWIFQKSYKPGMVRVPFFRDDLVTACKVLQFERIKNLGDIPYSFRFRKELPDSIRSTVPPTTEWIIVGTGQLTGDNNIAALELAVTEESELLKLSIVEEKHYRFTSRTHIPDEELRALAENEP